MVVDGQGSVASQPAGIACPGSCVAAFGSGMPVDLTALARSGYVLSFWRDDCAAADIPTNRVLMDSDKRCRVTFTARAPFPVAEFVQGSTLRVGSVVTFDARGSYVFDPVTLARDFAGITQINWDFERDGSIDASGGDRRQRWRNTHFRAPVSTRCRLIVEGGPFFETDDAVSTFTVQEGPVCRCMLSRSTRAATGRASSHPLRRAFSGAWLPARASGLCCSRKAQSSR